MREAEPLCNHIYSRLDCLGQHLSSVTVENETLRHEYTAILERFHASLVQDGDKRTITRVLIGRMIVCVCLELHKNLDDINTMCGVDILTDDRQWKQQFDADSGIHHDLLISALEQNHLENELDHSEAQTEALNVILFELNHWSGRYGRAELRLIDRLFHRAEHVLMLGIPSTPKWFIPPNEVSRANQISGERI